MSLACRPLVEVFEGIPDFRSRQGKRHPLSAILSLACVAMLCGYRSYGAIAEWGRNYGRKLARALGFTHQKTPCAATLHTVFRHLDRELLEARLGQWAEGILSVTSACPGEPEAVALDGKTLRGSRTQGAPGAHLLSAVSHRLGVTLAQKGVETPVHERSAVVEVLHHLVLEGRILTVDALLTQRQVAETILDGGGDYVMLVKGNQPQLQEDIQLLFEYPEGLEDLLATDQTVELGHGRIEQRRLTTSTALTDYSDWPGLKQVFQLQRTVTFKKTHKQRQETVYGVTSLSPQKADAMRLLTLTRHHWQIENGSHWVRDVTFDEDRSQVRCGSIPQVMAALRNTVIGLLRAAGEASIAAACRRFAAQPWHALALIGIKPQN